MEGSTANMDLWPARIEEGGREILQYACHNRRRPTRHSQHQNGKHESSATARRAGGFNRLLADDAARGRKPTRDRPQRSGITIVPELR
jgi:hypothetical protein